MVGPVNLLIVEDSKDDALLLVDALKSAGFKPTWKRVETEADYRARLEEMPELIISDFSLPRFNGLRAVELLNERGLDIPFILVSGTMGEEKAVEAMKCGVTDYLLKDRIGRLGSAVESALEQKRLRGERRRMQEQLVLQATALETSANGILITDRAGVILWANAGFVAVTGYAPPEVVGKTPRVLKSGRHDQTFYEHLWRTILSGQVWRGEFTNRRKDGSLFVDEHTISPVRAADGTITHFVGIMNDVTMRVQAQKELRATQEQLRHALEHSPAVIYSLKVEEDRVVPQVVSENIMRLVGYTVGESCSFDWWVSHLHPEDRAGQLASIAETVRCGVFNTEYRFQAKDGHYIWVEDSRRVVRDGCGKPKSIVGAWTDITERKRAQSLMLRTQRLESIGTLASGVAHDLNNALTPILMVTAMLREDFPSAKEIVDTLEASAKRGADMVRQLLTFAKGVEGARLLLQPKHLLHEMEKIIKATFPKGIELRTSYALKLYTVVGDATQLHQVLLNLCVNARDSMPDGGVLTLEAENAEIDANYAKAFPEAKPGRYVVLRVRDSGAGIPPDILERIFEPFFTTKTPEKGTGLGLSTVIGIVRSHGGFVQVYSTLGRGSTFTVYLPSCGDNPPDAPLTAAETTFRGDGETLLVVDDELTVRQVARSVLTALNFHVITACDGTEALIQVVEKRSELRAIITDLHMPHMDGLSFVRAIRHIVPKAGIIVASGRLDEREAIEFKALGVTMLLEKPFTQDKLVQALRAVFT